MKHICKEQPNLKHYNLTDELFNEDCIFFDIETTGFSPASSNIYLIGCLRKTGETLIIEQFFAENKDDEYEVLHQFFTLLYQYKTIISFNGSGFDIPFIKAKCYTHNIVENLDNFSHIDIFKLLNHMKFLLKLPNYKQKTIEAFLDIEREDLYSGGELLSVYNEYLHTKSSHTEELLLLHNYEDVIGMLDLIPILSYNKILNGAYEIKDTETTTYTNYEGNTGFELIITLANKYMVPKRVSHQYNDLYITMNKDITKIRIPIFKGELKFFYTNYKDYYYLPEEDMSIHKSVASYVDKEYREKAKACNCYTRKTGTFLPQYDAIINPAFKKDYKEKCSFFELTEDFKSSDVMLRNYVEHILSHCSNNK